MNPILYYALLFIIILIVIQIIVIFLSNIETGRRKILLVLDFLAIFLIYSGLLVLFARLQPILIFPFVILFFIIYNIFLFRVIKQFVLRSRISRMKEEISDVLIESLKALSELDHKGAYEILENALKRHPDSKELINLKTVFDKKLKTISTANDIKHIHE
jgi:hypothetical protein